MGDGDRDGSRAGLGNGGEAEGIGHEDAGHLGRATLGCRLVSEVDMRGGG